MSPAIPAARPVASDEQLTLGIASVIFELKFVQPLNSRYDRPGEFGGGASTGSGGGNGNSPVGSSGNASDSLGYFVTELTRITCGLLDGQLLCCAASSAADA